MRPPCFHGNWCICKTCKLFKKDPSYWSYSLHLEKFQYRAEPFYPTERTAGAHHLSIIRTGKLLEWMKSMSCLKGQARHCWFLSQTGEKSQSNFCFFLTAENASKSLSKVEESQQSETTRRAASKVLDRLLYLLLSQLSPVYFIFAFNLSSHTCARTSRVRSVWRKNLSNNVASTRYLKEKKRNSQPDMRVWSYGVRGCPRRNTFFRPCRPRFFRG